MDIKCEVEGSKATFKISGKIGVTTAPDLRAAIEATPATIRDFDINLSDVDYVSSAGLRAFVAADKLAAHRGGTLRIVSPCEDVLAMLKMTRLSEVIEIVS